MFGLNCGFDLKNIADLRAIWGVEGPNIWGSFRGPVLPNEIASSLESANVHYS